MSELVERMDTQSNKTEEVLKAMRYTELMSASGDKAVRDLPFIMMCAYQNHWKTTGIIPYEELTLDYTNCDRPSGGCSAMTLPVELLRLRQEDFTQSHSLETLI